MARLFAFLSALIITGCAATLHPDPASGIDKASGRITARAEFIGNEADKIINAPIGAPAESVKPHAETIKVEAKNITVDQAEVDRLMADERTAHGKAIEALQSELRNANAKPFYLVKLIGSIGGLGMLLVGIYVGISGKAWLNGGALALTGAVSLGVALAITYMGWLIAFLIVAALAVIGAWLVIETIRRMKRAAVSIPESIRKLEIAGKIRMDDDAKALMDETQTPLAKKYVDSVTKPVRKAQAKAGK